MISASNKDIICKTQREEGFMFKYFGIPLIFILPSLTFGQSYTRGILTCDDFAEMKEWYRNEPDNNYAKKAYAECLIAKGEGAKGFSILQAIIGKHNDVSAAFMLAQYIESGGRLDNTVDEDSVDEAIAAFLQVLTFIEVSRDYPYNGFWHTEEGRQMELHSHYSVALLYSAKFMYGAAGSDNEYMGLSHSKRTYPEYSRYTKDSLKQTIHYAERCLALPRKAHFKPEKYRKIISACQVLKEEAEALLPLEDKRLFYLAQYNSCKANSSNCDGYIEVKDEMVAIMRQAKSDRRDIFGVKALASQQ